jgi:hypothetical protein
MYEAGKRRERPHYSGVVSPETLFAGWMRKDYFIPGCLLWRSTLPGTPFATSAPLLQEKLYDTAHLAFRRKHTDLGRQALREVRKRGFRGHPGNLPHRILASLIGLVATVQLRGR